jgi:GNAT superfamily N-acetyltransferase
VTSRNHSGVSLRAIRGDEPDLDALLTRIDAVLISSFKTGSRRSVVERFLRVEPNGWVVAEEGEVLLAVGGCIAYRDAGFGWLGLIGTSPDAQHRGLGRSVTTWLVDYLAKEGCAAVLDGSASGAPLYESMGFSDFGRSQMMLAPDVVPHVEDTRIGVAHAADLQRIYRYDLPRFGADRSRLLQAMFELYPGRVLFAQDQGAILGFGIAQDHAIGPVVAENASVAKALLSALCCLPWPTNPRMVLASETAYTNVVLELGFVEQRALRRQQLGRSGPLPGNRAVTLAQTSFGEG